jgi:hypothetical protein
MIKVHWIGVVLLYILSFYVVWFFVQGWIAWVCSITAVALLDRYIIDPDRYK